MARIHGLGSISTNFELSLRRPLDARMLVSKKEDLINPDSWTLYTFNGMIVAVGSDPEASNNGIYILKDRSNITTYEAWSKVAELGDLESLETRISALESIEIPENIVTAEELEAALQQIRNEMAEIDLSLYATKDELSAKQDKLTAGDNITISEEGVISAAVSEQYDDSEIRSLIDSNTQGLSTLQSQLDSIPNEYIDNDELSAVENKLRAEIEEVESKIPSLENYYTEEEVNNLLLNKADKSELFSGDYNDLVNKPEIPSIEGLATETFVINKIAEAELNDKEVDLTGYATKDDLLTKADKEHTHEQYLVAEDLNDYAKAVDIPSVEGLASEEWVNNQGFLKEHQDISHLETKEDSSLKLQEAKDYTDTQIGLINIPSIEGLATEQYVNDQIGLIEIPDVSNKADKSELFSGDYNDLTNKPEIPSIDGLASEQYVQDQIGLIEIPDISGKADKSELESYYTKEESNQLLEEKANKSELFSGSYDDLTNKPEIPSVEGLATEEYVQEQVSSKVDTKELESYYGKSEVDSLLQNKADSSSVYTKEEVDQKIENIDIPEMPTSWNADEVFFEQDLIFTEGFGKYVPDNSGSVKILTKTNNMSLQDLLLSAFSEEKDPVTTQPTISLKSSNIGSKEVGTKISVQYNFADETTGSYSYGPDTGVIWSDYSATFNGQTVEGISGTFDEVQVTDNTSLVINGSAKHSSGSTPKTNLGNDFVPEEITDELGAIQEKTISVQKGTLSGYRKMFFGTMSEKVDITSNIIRGLATSQAAAKVSDKEFTIPVGAMRVVLAVPSMYSVSKCLDVNGFNTDLIATGGMLGPIAVSVEGANNYNAIVYDVYYQDYANANDTVNTYKVTVIKD